MRLALAQIEAYPNAVAIRDTEAIHYAWKERLTWGIDTASRSDADVVVFPELATIPYLVSTSPELVQSLAVSKHDALVQEAVELAKSRDVALVLPFPETEGGRLYNSLAAFDRKGEEVAHYRKIHIPEGERAREKLVFSAGVCAPCVFRLEGVLFGAAICYDRHFPELFRVMALKGAHVALVPSAAAGSLKSAWEAEGVAHATFNRMFYAAINRAGVESDVRRPFFGESFVSSPWGEVLAKAEASSAECLVVDVSSAEVEKARRAWPFLDEQKRLWRVDSA